MNDERLTLQEIEARYPNEWVLIADLDTDEFLEIRSGTVLFHSPDRDETDGKAIELRPGYFSVRYTGELEEDDMEYIL